MEERRHQQIEVKHDRREHDPWDQTQVPVYCPIVLDPLKPLSARIIEQSNRIFPYIPDTARDIEKELIDIAAGVRILERANKSLLQELEDLDSRPDC